MITFSESEMFTPPVLHAGKSEQYDFDKRVYDFMVAMSASFDELKAVVDSKL